MKNDTEIFFVVRELNTLALNSHINAYKVEMTNIWSRLSYIALYNYGTSFVHNCATGETFVVLNFL